MTMRLRVICALLCLGLTVGWVMACGNETTMPSPSARVIGLTIGGNNRLTALGQTVRLIAEASYPDGIRKDVSSSAQWSTSDRNIATVSLGLVTAIAPGRVTITASFDSTSAQVPLDVVPAGTYVLSGRAFELGNLPVADVRVELVGGPDSGKVTTTDFLGRYTFAGVSGVAQVRGTKDGYQPATQDVSQNTENVNIQLTAAVPYASLGGNYRLVFTASSSCRLPADVMSRSYAATINQVGPGAVLTVKLSDAEFWSSGRLLWNQFTGRVIGNLISFKLYDSYLGFYYGGGLVEQLATDRYLALVGTAEVRVPGPTAFTAVFAGSALLGANAGSGSIATCAAADHQLAFTRLP